ncbi:PD40 domain-containing protein [Schlesneria paludicola]|uniref:PD40 domain-containing protein n=1 Tax=Schlesneria paludicola TaxID=360056 RepID=UPI00138AAE9C|nr:PD40 domain-containing protein [Schlesneria paludicola]
MDLWQRLSIASVLIACSCLISRILDAADARLERIQAVFSRIDQDRDEKLTIAEFTADRKPLGAAQRDFRLFDRNHDQFLSSHEFASIPGAVAPADREPTNDPIVDLVDQLMSGMDQSLDNWNENPDVEINVNHFTRTVQSSFKNAHIRLDPVPADLNQDHKISRAEARQFLEIQMGVRTDHGTLLRAANGQILNYGQFHQFDLDHNDQLDRAEFEKSIDPAEEIPLTFESADTNQDRSVSLEEWGRLGGERLVDPIADFLELDTNFDAYVAPDELAARMQNEQHHVLKKTFPAFDLDLDGKLSLAEYRITMRANPAWNWYKVPADQNNDGHLEFAEFSFEGASSPLLRLMYFKQLDLNSDQRLEPHEFPLRIKRPNEFYSLQEDGSNLQFLWGGEDHPVIGSPTVSPDGKWLAFDELPIGSTGGEQIYVIPIKGGTARKICSGVMPSWSPDSRLLACSRRAPHFGVWLADVTTGETEIIVQSHWGQLSPNGKSLMIGVPNILVYDMETESKKSILGTGTNPFVKVYRNGAWSPDSMQFCFKGRNTENQIQIATVQIAGDPSNSTLQVHHTFAITSTTNFAWHPSGHRVVFSMPCLERDGLRQLYEFDPGIPGSVQLVAGQDPTRNNIDSCWTPDGRRLIFASGDFCDD